MQIKIRSKDGWSSYHHPRTSLFMINSYISFFNFIIFLLFVSFVDNYFQLFGLIWFLVNYQHFLICKIGCFSGYLSFQPGVDCLLTLFCWKWKLQLGAVFFVEKGWKKHAFSTCRVVCFFFQILSTGLSNRFKQIVLIFFKTLVISD